MKGIEIVGGNRLKGEIAIHGSKNAVLPIMAAALLNKGMTVIRNCPIISDVLLMADILRELGCLVTIVENEMIIDASSIDNVSPSRENMGNLRASFLLLGALLGRYNEVYIPYPGGCCIGERPVDLHLMAMEKLGAQIWEEEQCYHVTASELMAGDIHFEKVSVGATQNAILAAVYAKGVTRITNAATEPEVIELCRCLTAMGAIIGGIGTSKLKIRGTNALHDVVYEVKSDRIVAGTYMLAGVLTGGDITLRYASADIMDSVIGKIQRLGANVIIYKDGIHIQMDSEINSISYTITKPYPGFPTDMQPQLISALAVASGQSIVRETVFESRFKSAMELIKLGANISFEGDIAIINGVKELYGGDVYASDLRGGAALVLAGLRANGITRVLNANYIDRGYVDICQDLEKLGAQIRWMRMKEDNSLEEKSKSVSV